jgi:hypothetical protein
VFYSTTLPTKDFHIAFVLRRFQAPEQTMRDIERDGKLLVPKDIGVSVGCAYCMSQSVRLHAHFFANGHAATER